MATKKQVVIIHGGDFFDTREEFFESLKKDEVTLEDLVPSLKKSWKDTLAGNLGDSYEVFQPKMPLAIHARYEEWKIWFDKIAPFLKDRVILIGHSLGGTFLSRYLAENEIPVKVRGVFLVAPYFAKRNDSAPEENAGWTIGGSLKSFEDQVNEIVIYHSDDDETVPMSHALEYKALLSKAKLVTFNDRNHFRIEKFPELVSAIKSLA